MSSRTNKALKSTPVKGKSKKPDTTAQSKRQKQEPTKPLYSSKLKRPAPDLKPVAKIPTSREESSSNWKTLLQKQGKSLPAITSSLSRPSKTMENSQDVKRFRNSSGSDSGSVSTDRSRSMSHTRCSSQLSMTSEAPSSAGTDNFDTESEAGVSKTLNDQSLKVKQEFRALGLSESKGAQRQSRGPEKYKLPPRRVVRTPPAEGLNEFGYFDYTHYGVLRTPITPDHADFMEDTGIIAMDCEMVGVGPMSESALARVSIVNEFGFCLYDRFVKPKLEVTDYRTQFSGIRENDLRNAVPFQIVAKEVADILKGHILVGHSLKSDLAVLYLNHPKPKIRDTAFFFKKILRSKTPKLKMLVKKILGVEIQQGEHSSITDAQATMALYQLYQAEWEASARQSNRGIDVLKQTLDEFRQLKPLAIQSNHQLPKQPEATFYNNNNNNNNNQSTHAWYESTGFCSDSAFSNNPYSFCSDECCGDSVSVSPSVSPPTSLDSMGYPVADVSFHAQRVMDDCVPLPHYPPPGFPPNINFVPYQTPVPAPIPQPALQFPCYSYGAINGMIVPTMNFAPPPVPTQLTVGPPRKATFLSACPSYLYGCVPANLLHESRPEK